MYTHLLYDFLLTLPVSIFAPLTFLYGEIKKNILGVCTKEAEEQRESKADWFTALHGKSIELHTQDSRNGDGLSFVFKICLFCNNNVNHIISFTITYYILCIYCVVVINSCFYQEEM